MCLILVGSEFVCELPEPTASEGPLALGGATAVVRAARMNHTKEDIWTKSFGWVRKHLHALRLFLSPARLIKGAR